MKTTRELLELAAKAVGGLLFVESMNSWIHVAPNGERGAWWNPLTDDGDALRLAVKLQIDVCFDFTIPVDDDPMTATRRAIVRAAAEIGKEPT